MLPREQKISESCLDLNLEKCVVKKQGEFSASQGQDNALDKSIQADTDVCAKKEKEKYFMLGGKGLELRLGDEILENKIQLLNSSSGSCTHLRGAENSEYAAAETFKSETNSPKVQHDLVSGDKPGYTSPYDTRSKQSNIGSKPTEKHKWWRNKKRSSDDTNKQEWIVDFPAPRPQKHEEPGKQNHLSYRRRVQYRLFQSRTLERDSQHWSSKQESKLKSSKFVSPDRISPDETQQTLEDIDEDYRRLNEQCRSMASNIQQQATRARDWRSRIREIFHEIRYRARQIFSRKRD
ncbi:hypothetical protein TNCT_252181 [Trichonephila clavata]|uniref:Uncharacterized protein n=1 Tax=Trichonephila clavata TaxID=2740835 RepID=A0A8X6FNF4_TRICU|nr:hypothetical protein TNCT_252181 [Trichonephila clavata]